MSAIILDEVEEGLVVRGERDDGRHVTLFVVFQDGDWRRSYSRYASYPGRKVWRNQRWIVARDPEGKREITHHTRLDLAQREALRRIRRWVK